MKPGKLRCLVNQSPFNHKNPLCSVGVVGEPHYYKNCPQRARLESTVNIQEASTVGEVARGIPRINAILEDHLDEHQPAMVEFEGKIDYKPISILIDSGASLSYISQKIIDLCQMQGVKFKNP